MAAMGFAAGNEKDEQTFIDAFNNKTLIVQNASDVQGLDYKDNSVITGTSEDCHYSFNFNGAFIQAQNAAGHQANVLQLPIIGGIYFAWKNS
jgi:hypothetical protein